MADRSRSDAERQSLRAAEQVEVKVAPPRWAANVRRQTGDGYYNRIGRGLSGDRRSGLRVDAERRFSTPAPGADTAQSVPDTRFRNQPRTIRTRAVS